MTDLESLPFVHDDGRLPNGAKGRRCRRHSWASSDIYGNQSCVRCDRPMDPAISRRSRNNGKRGRRAELTVAREIPGARKMPADAVSVTPHYEQEADHD
jgi:hypothetical protein